MNWNGMREMCGCAVTANIGLNSTESVVRIVKCKKHEAEPQDVRLALLLSSLR